MSGPVDQTILAALRSSPVGPAMDKPVDQILRDMGLPPLPEIPSLPEFPMPALDLSAFARPLTDLASSFGTGLFPAAPEVDPVQALSQVSSVVQTAVQVSSAAMQLAAGLWQGAGAEGAAAKQAQVDADSTTVAVQSAQTSQQVAVAAGSVARGSLALSAIIAKFLTSVAMAAPFIGTPPGQVFLATMSAETLAEALAVVGVTRAELTAHSAAMTATGTKVPVTEAPGGQVTMQLLSQVMQMVPGVVDAATAGAGAVAEAVAGSQPRGPANTALAQHKSIADPGRLPSGGGVPMLTGGGNSTPAPRPLTPWTGAPAAGNTGSSSPSAATSTASSPAGAPMRGNGPGFMPAGGATGGMARGAGESTTSGLPGQLVSGQHGNEVVGDIDTATPPVIGAVGSTPGSALDGPPPDKALTL
ncbi:hypothetical protein [Nocardia jinanensis]|uniref:PPE family protein n=1 Tax=Nocardia jinanensis TaxID=382504 RepID=A0A917RAM6_9NOCA|nr:hypothetical protein [Nocardia jinanensis]GGK98656.1 hypothetical protein GCM10011588_11540 [Nocardia jinanensis]